MKPFYEAVASRYARLYQRTGGIDLTVTAGASVLVLGGGGGREARELLELGALVTVVDFSPAMLLLVPDDVEKVEADVFSGALPFAQDRFDVVVATHGLLTCCDESERLVRLLREVARVGFEFRAEVPEYTYLQDGKLIETHDLAAVRQGDRIWIKDKTSDKVCSNTLRTWTDWLELFRVGLTGFELSFVRIENEWRLNAKRTDPLRIDPL